MFFNIYSGEENDSIFSYLLCKKPGSIYDKNKIRGEYLGNVYSITSNLSFTELLPTLKERNEEVYNSYQLYGVTPYFLNSIYECLRSAFTNNYKDEIINFMNKGTVLKDESIRERYICFDIGPFLCDFGDIHNVFSSLGFNVFKTYDNFDVAYGLHLTIKSTLQVALQKVFMICLYSTFNYNMFPISDEQIDKYIKMCQWLESDNSYTKNIIRTLCRSNKSLEKKFIESVIDIDDDQEVVKEQLYIDFTTLHQLRHKWISDQVVMYYSLMQKEKQVVTEHLNIIDYGCANGRLSVMINDKLKDENIPFDIYAYDASEKAGRGLDKFKHIHFYQMNLLYPNVSILPQSIDIVLLSEIIEHFDDHERKQLMDFIINVINPKVIILTTPNYDYNSKLFDSGKIQGNNGYRDKGHKIEFTWDQFKSEVSSYFEKNKYEISYAGIELAEDKKESIIHSWILDGANMPGCGVPYYDTPSILAVIANSDPNRKLPFSYKTSSFHSQIYLPVSDYIIEGKEISNGYSNRAFLTNSANIFYIAPTVPPVDFSKDHNDYLEYPTTVFDYYRSRGITELVAEKKYMGSRAHILLFKSLDIAKDFNMDKLIYINTRNGNKFFDDDSMDQEFYDSIVDQLEYDVTILDTEMMPWSLKGKWLIRNKFQGIGECATIDRTIKKDVNGLINVDKYMQSLQNYIAEEEPYCRVFNILALGDKVGNKYDWILGKELDNIEKLGYIRSIENDKFKCVESIHVNLNDPKSINNCISSWIEYTENGGEGFVFKPLVQRQYAQNGYMIQPSLKVRGKDYLLLIYGIDMYENKNFNVICKRQTKMKRLLAIQENELGDLILSSFIHKRQLVTKRLVAGFLGMEGISFNNIDKTL